MSEPIPDVKDRKCDTCERHPGCHKSLDDDYEGLPNHAWNCWRPKGTILVWQEKEVGDVG